MAEELAVQINIQNIPYQHETLTWGSGGPSESLEDPFYHWISIKTLYQLGIQPELTYLCWLVKKMSVN